MTFVLDKDDYSKISPGFKTSVDTSSISCSLIYDFSLTNVLYCWLCIKVFYTITTKVMAIRIGSGIPSIIDNYFCYYYCHNVDPTDLKPYWLLCSTAMFRRRGKNKFSNQVVT